MKTKRFYNSKGFVYGKLWCGGFGAYKAEELSSNNLKDLEKELNRGIKEGWLDAGMGFDYLKGAIIDIYTTETIKAKNKDYSRTEINTKFIGDLTQEEEEFLLDILLNN